MTLPKKQPIPDRNRRLHLFRTPAEARTLSSKLSKIAPNASAVETGLFELFMNAIEHGNLAIGHQEKQHLLEEDRLQQEIENRLKAPPYSRRQVQVEVFLTDTELSFTIQDEGMGFDWQAFRAREAHNLNQCHGRGILIARRLAFSRLDYRGNGNCVTATVML